MEAARNCEHQANRMFTEALKQLSVIPRTPSPEPDRHRPQAIRATPEDVTDFTPAQKKLVQEMLRQAMVG